MTDLVNELARLLEGSPAHDLVLDAADRLRRELHVDAEVWIADYAQRTLHGVLSGEIRPIDDSLIGRSFAGQVSVSGDGSLALPLTTRGDRLGVLEITPGDIDQRELDLFASLLASGLKSSGTATGAYEQHRRRRTMTVAAELQWALLPGQAYRDHDVTIGALLEPAYSIAGDAYDWTRDEDTLHLAVLDATGRGVTAALATTLALGAIRNARFADVSLADQAALADQAVYAHYAGESFTSALMFQFHVPTGRAWVVDAGSPQLFQIREGKVLPVALDAQLPLGMFEETIYVEQEIDLQPGDRLVIVSDGIHGTRLPDGRDFGAAYLEQTLRDARLLSPAELTRHVVRRLSQQHSEHGPDDDAVVVCLDWHPSSRPG